MLQELKANLEQSANVLIPEWKTLTKNELLNAYVDAKTTQEKEGYLYSNHFYSIVNIAVC